MRLVPATLLAFTVLVTPFAAQERSAPKKPLTFAEAVEQAKKAIEAEKLGAAVTALQAAIRDVQKKQRTAILACLPKPEGWTIQDNEVDENADALGATMVVMGLSLTRRYENGDKSLAVEVTANSPMLQMLTVVFSNPALITADGGELVKYGPHKAILKKSGDNGQELQILMHDTHLIKVDAQGLSADDLLKIFDQAFVDRLEKPLGK
ncbi:MAG: hypothetical protein JNK78_14480 [Planctomycetes bacterium]|nr:hypothetical protein [Planctomycetota bacterium]